MKLKPSLSPTQTTADSEGEEFHLDAYADWERESRALPHF